MALTSTQIASRLFKKSLGVGETNINYQYYGESLLGRTTIIPSQIWSEADLIPYVAPTLSNGNINGVVQYYDKLELTLVVGTTNSFTHNLLIDTIPFNHGDKESYLYKIYKNDGTTQISFGENDWLLDTEAGILTFYNGVPTDLPPKISFYRYVGTKGLQTSISTSTINVKEPVKVATLNNISNFSGVTIIDTITLTIGDRVLIKDQNNSVENGIYVLSGSTLVRSDDNNGDPLGEVGVSDYVLVLDGDINNSNSYILASTNAINKDRIVVGVDTQIWTLFSKSKDYSGIISAETSNRLSGDTSLSTALSTESTNRLSGDTSLSTALSIETNKRINSAGSGLTYNVSTSKLDVVVDDFTIKIINNELRTPLTWMQLDTDTTILMGTTGLTNISLTYDPIGYISSYVNGVEYLVSHNTSPQIGMPFFFSEIPTNGSILKYSSVMAGFGLESGIDAIMIKYNFIEQNI